MLKKGRARFLDKFKSKSGTSKPLEVPDEENPERSMTEDGELTEHDLRIGRTGLRINGEAARAVQLEVKPEDLEDLEVTLGSGASSVVRKVRHRPSGLVLAMKVIGLDVTEEVRNKLFVELRTYHSSSHPSIVSFYGASYEEGSIRILLEYMDGSLADVIKNRPLPENILSKVTAQILRGLSYLHKDLHIVHRDIKPANILINKRGEVKVSDFGVSTQLKDTLGLAETFTGTVTYMDPGRIAGQLHSSNSDVWSLGLTIMECALGYYPYRPPSKEKEVVQFFDLYDAIVNHDPPSLPGDQFSKEFCDFVAACLCKNATKRPFAAELLDHPFIQKYDQDPVDVAEWVRTALADHMAV